MKTWVINWFLGTCIMWLWVVPGASTAICATFCWTAICLLAMLLDAGGKARREGVPKSYQVNVPVKGGVNLGSSADIPPLPRRDAERMVH